MPPQEKTLRIGALNIKTSPATPETYISLFKKAVNRRTAANYRGKSFAEIGTFDVYDTEDEPAFAGQVGTYLDFDPEMPWYNKSAGKEADEQELKTIQIPRNLKPEFKPINFIFFPAKHRFFFELALTHSSMAKIIYSILNQQRTHGMGRIEVLIEQSQEPLEHILSLRELRRLEIVVSKPNPDDTGKYDKIIKERLARQHASKMTTVLESEHGVGLTPDKETLSLANLALSDGVVRGHGVAENGRVVDTSTEDHPLLLTVTFNPKVQQAIDKIHETALKAINKIRDRLQK